MKSFLITAIPYALLLIAVVYAIRGHRDHVKLTRENKDLRMKCEFQDEQLDGLLKEKARRNARKPKLSWWRRI